MPSAGVRAGLIGYRYKCRAKLAKNSQLVEDDKNFYSSETLELH